MNIYSFAQGARNKMEQKTRREKLLKKIKRNKEKKFPFYNICTKFPIMEFSLCFILFIVPHLHSFCFRASQQTVSSLLIVAHVPIKETRKHIQQRIQFLLFFFNNFHNFPELVCVRVKGNA